MLNKFERYEKWMLKFEFAMARAPDILAVIYSHFINNIHGS